MNFKNLKIFLIVLIVLVLSGCTSNATEEPQPTATSTIMPVPAGSEIKIKLQLIDMDMDPISNMWITTNAINGVNAGHPRTWSTDEKGYVNMYATPGEIISWVAAHGSVNYYEKSGELTITSETDYYSIQLKEK